MYASYVSFSVALPLGHDSTDPLYGGVLACAAVNSILWRRSDEPVETWTSYAALVKTVSTAQAHDSDAELLTLANANPKAATQALARVSALREPLFDILSTIAAHSPATGLDLTPLNDTIKHAASHLIVRARPDGTMTADFDNPLDLDRPLWQTALSAAALLASDHRARIKQCPGPPCGWLFLDSTRNGSRRWCDPALCGNRDKVRAHYWRHKDDTTTATADNDAP